VDDRQRDCGSGEHSDAEGEDSGQRRCGHRFDQAKSPLASLPVPVASVRQARTECDKWQRHYEPHARKAALQELGDGKAPGDQSQRRTIPRQVSAFVGKGEPWVHVSARIRWVIGRPRRAICG